MRLNKDFRYCTFIEQPESFAKQFSDIDKLSELFRFLGDKMKLKVVMYLLSLYNGEVAGATTIATHLGYPKEKIEKALQYLLSINGSNKE
ncbi:XRE family transcriptional regulator, partial [[Eubacterium] siraeum]|nr:XRE family transcriptional regulator [[Eubacterium] siraeum]